MTRSRLILAIRFTLLAVLCFFPLTSWLAFASFAWVPLGLFMPVFSVTCAACSTMPSVTATINYTNVSPCTSCDDLDGSYLMTLVSDPTVETGCFLYGSNFCVWKYTFSSPVTSCSAPYFYVYYVLGSPNILAIEIPFASGCYHEFNNTTSGNACASFGTKTLHSSGGSASGSCCQSAVNSTVVFT